MEFAFTDEQQMIRETAAQFLADHSTSAAVRAVMAGETGFDATLWQRICGEMCWSAIHIPEAYGGLGLGYVELAAVLEEMGKHLLCAPFFSSICLGANALLVAASDAQKAEFLPLIADGSLRATLAWCDASGRWDGAGISAQCTRREERFLLNGSYRFVVDGHSADLLIVAARAPGSVGNDGISLFAVPAATPGIQRNWLPGMDQTRKLAQIEFDDVLIDAAALLGDEGGAWGALECTLQLATIALAAEQAGGAQRILDMAVDYTRERQQFGRAIASFQAIKHKAADMMLKAEACRSAVYYAACVAQEALTGGALGSELASAASLAKAYCSEAYFHNAGTALQLYGGVGFTWEYDVHLYFKRARASESFLGDASAHRERIAVELGL
ncbi:MAG: acyl-CoA/acyl-ACP dehydrogenase [Pseudomonadales bacterium]|nr:acyl-CoA/acyl-ACP dehydrogenase [Pseudomonadales bacterium]